MQAMGEGKKKKTTKKPPQKQQAQGEQSLFPRKNPAQGLARSTPALLKPCPQPPSPQGCLPPAPSSPRAQIPEEMKVQTSQTPHFCSRHCLAFSCSEEEEGLVFLLSPLPSAPSPWVSLPRCLSAWPGVDPCGGSACAVGIWGSACGTGMVAPSAAWGQRWGRAPAVWVTPGHGQDGGNPP